MHGKTVLVLALIVLSGCTRCAGEQKVAVTAPAVFAEGKKEVSLLFVGDLSVARGIADTIDKKGGGDPAYPFALIRELLHGHDLTFGNLECVLSDSSAEEAVSKTYRIRADTKYAAALKESGLDVVSVANNHAMDFGAQGFNSTLDTTRKLGLIPVGMRVQEHNAQAPVIVLVGELKVGFLAYNQHGDEYKHPQWRPSAALYDMKQMLNDIKKARPQVDVLVVSVHGGPELSHQEAQWQHDDSRTVIDAGADLWIGHHPHVAQPFLEYKHGLIAYSLGDFLFDKSSPWLVHKNRPRLFLAVKFAKVDGVVRRLSYDFIGGDQDRDFRSFVDRDFTKTESFREAPEPREKTFLDLLPQAKVERVRADVVTACDRWEQRRQMLPAHRFRWLAPRWGCGLKDTEDKRAWETVAATAEVFEGSLRRGIWAHPHAGGPLRFTFPNVLLGTELKGFAGVPDWGLIMAKKQTFAPVRVSVRIGEQKKATVIDVPYAAPLTELVFDTTKLAGQTKDVVVEIEGGSGDAEGRFVFDLAAK